MATQKKRPTPLSRAKAAAASARADGNELRRELDGLKYRNKGLVEANAEYQERLKSTDEANRLRRRTVDDTVAGLVERLESLVVEATEAGGAMTPARWAMLGATIARAKLLLDGSGYRSAIYHNSVAEPRPTGIGGIPF